LKYFTSSHFWVRVFWIVYWKLPTEVREPADKNFEPLKENHRHPSLPLKRIEELWSARVGMHYRTIGIDAPEGIQWIWVGSHADYDKLITSRDTFSRILSS